VRSKPLAFRFAAVIVVACCATLPLGCLPACAADDVAANEAGALDKREIEAVPKVAFEAEAVLTAPGGFTRELKMLHKPLGGGDANYIEVTAPLNLKDTRFLFLEHASGPDEQYIYVPALKRTIQVLDEARKQPFLGSDFYVSDLVAPDLDAYNYAFAAGADTEIGGRACKLVEATPKNPQGELYSKAVIAIDPVDLLVVRSEFYDPKGALLKVWTLEKVEKVDGYWTPMLHKMANVKQSTESRIETKRVRYNVEIADSVFTKTNLQR
jgi:outer membrane lipoprotein-sorting protein